MAAGGENSSAKRAGALPGYAYGNKPYRIAASATVRIAA
jgi:hypothetical protein